ncbi:hypothetical protein [Thauera sinica]|uniref:Multidrug transporter n=1 Tax=Thauera sinica TaxID=2665146 RepID=A0ABW1AX63_9RHOO|nr:hypothetical protein [Thauera sp. K11]ATE61103.1 hypothetical protein CCZ27_15190 [Thauera sp. K11]
MKRLLRNRVQALSLIAALALSPVAPVAAQQNDTVTGDRGGDMAVDLVVVRPLGIIATVIGTAGFVLALPFTVPSGSAGDTAREWVAAPFEYTFNRPLGDFDRCGADRHPCGGR